MFKTCVCMAATLFKICISLVKNLFGEPGRGHLGDGMWEMGFGVREACFSKRELIQQNLCLGIGQTPHQSVH